MLPRAVAEGSGGWVAVRANDKTTRMTPATNKAMDKACTKSKDHFLSLFLSELNHRLGDSALLLRDFMLPAMEGDNWSKVTLRPLDRRKSLQKNWHLHHLESGGNDSSVRSMIVETVQE